MSDDVERIHDLMLRYAELFDGGDLEGFAELFVRGSLTFKGIDPPCIGSEGVLDFIDRRVIMHRGKPRTNHVMSNIIVRVGEDRTTATARSHVTVFQATPDLPLQVIVTGQYNDVFARDESGWYFVERTAGGGGLTGNLTQHLRLEASPTRETANV